MFNAVIATFQRQAGIERYRCHRVRASFVPTGGSMPKIVACFVAMVCMGLPAFADTLVFSPLPMETPYTVASQWKPLLAYLERKLGVTMTINYSHSNDEAVDKLRKGEVDLAYLGPLPYVTLKSSFDAVEPLLAFNEKNGGHTYTCAIAVTTHSPLALSQMRNKRIALTQPLSTCGYFAVQGMLQQAGTSLENNRYRYIGPHDEVALSIVRGEFDAGGLKTAIARKYAHLGLKVLAESPEMPGLALIANRNRLSPERIAQIRQALLEADEETRKAWGDNIRYGASAIDDRAYDGMRQLSMPAAIPQQGNF